MGVSHVVVTAVTCLVGTTLPSLFPSYLSRCCSLAFVSFSEFMKRDDWGNVDEFASDLGRFVHSQLGGHGVPAIV